MEVRYGSGTIQDLADSLGRLSLKVQYNCHTTIANQTASILYVSNSSDRANGGFIPYIKTSVQPTPTDTGTNFPAFVNAAAPTTLGIVGYVRDAVEVIQATVPQISIYNSAAVVAGAAYMTAGVVTRYGLTSGGDDFAGNASYLGATTAAASPATGNNIALVVFCTGLDGHAAIGPVTFWVDVVYKRLPYQV